MKICAAGVWKRSAILELLQLNSTGAGALQLRYVSFRCFTGRKRKERGKQTKEREKIGGGRKNRLSIFLEIVINNLYLLYYYRVIKIEDVNYIIK
jgi:hypothetical protein